MFFKFIVMDSELGLVQEVIQIENFRFQGQ